MSDYELRETVTVNTLPTTETDCPLCETGTFCRDGHELICDTCQHSPTFETKSDDSGPWELHREQVYSSVNDSQEPRPKLVGGYEEAYWDSGEYSFDIGEGQFNL